jgi:hypothetical protein
VFKAGSLMAILSVFVFALFGPSLCSCFFPMWLLFGGASGWLAGLWETPVDQQQAAVRGAVAGLIAGIGAAAGGLFSHVLWTWIGRPDGLVRFLAISNDSAPSIPYNGLLSVALLGAGLCPSVLLAVLMSAAGALGGWLYIRAIALAAQQAGRDHPGPEGG